MPVAPTFQKYEMLSTEPYEVSGRLYVRVRHPKTRNERQVRWYSDKEYAKLYSEILVVNEVESIYTRPQKEVLGFQKEYITIFKGDQEIHAEYLRDSNARYTRWWGWYIVSTEDIPADLPTDLIPIQLMWEDVGEANGRLKPEAQIKRVIDSLFYDADDNSQFMGKIGERLDLVVVLRNSIVLENNFGCSTMYCFDDLEGNHYLWTTSSKGLFSTQKEQYHIRGTVKSHQTYKNKKQTVLLRCTEVK